MESKILSDIELKEFLRGPSGLHSDVHVARIRLSILYYEDTLRQKSEALEDPVVGCWWFNPWKKGSSPGQLKNDIQICCNKLQSLRSLLAPVRRLPPDLLLEIFQHCLPSRTYVPPSPGSAPLLLTQICAAWRMASCSMPKLWASLELRDHPTESMPTHHSNIVNLMDMWLSRSGEYPLSLSILDGLLSVPELLYRFNSVSHRWQHIKINFVDQTPPLIILRESNLLPRLESFALQSSRGLSVQQLHNISCTLQNSAPRLSHFAWADNKANSEPTGINFNWSHLTHLTLNVGISICLCLDILKQSNCVVDASFLSIIHPPVKFLPQPVFLPKLQALVLAGVNITPLLDCLTLPSLREFVLNIQEYPQKSVIEFFRRSQCPIENFNLYFPTLEESDFLECLEHLQGSLKEFTLQMKIFNPPVITDHLLDRLTYRGEHKSCLCPKLEVFAVYDCLFCSEDKLKEMVMSRLQSPVLPRTDPLFIARIKVVEFYNTDEKVINWLRPFMSQGLILKLYSHEDGAVEIEMESEDTMQRYKKMLREEGLVLRIYDPQPGHFGEADYPWTSL